MKKTLNNEPLISVGMLTYNRPDRVRTAIENVLAQTYRNWELHISDNASPEDETRKICEAYAVRDARIHYHRQPVNLGISGNFEATYRLAHRGEYFMWLADDDRIEPEFMAYCLELLDGNLDAALAFPAESLMNSNGQIVDDRLVFTRFNRPRPTMELLRKYLWEPEVWAKAHMFYGLFRRRHLEVMMPLCIPQQHDVWGGDFVFIYGLLARFPVVMGDGKVLFTKDERVNAARRVIPVPAYQTVPVRQWPYYFRRMLAMAPTWRHRLQLWWIMPLRLLHKVFYALPLKLVYRLTGLQLVRGRWVASPNRG